MNLKNTDVIILCHNKNHMQIEHWKVKNHLLGKEIILSPRVRNEIGSSLWEVF